VARLQSVERQEFQRTLSVRQLATPAVTPELGAISGGERKTSWIGTLSDFRLIPALERNEENVAFAATITGKLVLLLLFGGGLIIQNSWRNAAILLAILAAAAFLPNHRRRVLTIGSLLWLAANPYWFDWAVPQFVAGSNPSTAGWDFRALYGVSLVALLGLATAWISLARRHPALFFCRRPLVTLFLLYSALVMLASFTDLDRVRAAAWIAIVVLGAYLWFLAYAISDQSSRDPDSPVSEIGTFHAFWGSTATPLPKGAAYLRRIESKTSRDLAITQLKALKLLLWADILGFCNLGFGKIAHGTLGIPVFEDAFDRCAAHAPYPGYLCWLVLLAAFAEKIFAISVWGHTAIACCRMAGFRALRNTYRPLSSRTIADFWNRYYFYFKELLVDFFFYPTFFRYFRRWNRLRLAVATFAAAAVGNMLFHFIRDIRYVAELGLRRAVLGFHVYVFYCCVLAAGIVVSQLRSSVRRARPPFLGGLPAQFGVLLFFCLLQVFDDDGRTHAITTHFAFLLHLFGVGG
jgi:hypothetical protein